MSARSRQSTRQRQRVAESGGLVVLEHTVMLFVTCGGGDLHGMSLRLRHRKGQEQSCGYPRCTGYDRPGAFVSRGLSSCTEGFHFSYSCRAAAVMCYLRVRFRSGYATGKGMSSPVAIRDAPVTTGRARSSAGGCRRAPKGSTSVTHVGLRLSCAICEFGSAPVTPQERA